MFAVLRILSLVKILMLTILLEGPVKSRFETTHRSGCPPGGVSITMHEKSQVERERHVDTVTIMFQTLVVNSSMS